MNANRVRWRAGSSAVRQISQSLRAIRSRREVAELLGLSPSVIAQLEASALRKILLAMREEAAADDVEPVDRES